MIEFLLNGESIRVDVEDDTPLLWVLRENLKLTGTKFGCGMGLCGACTVHLAGVAVRSCQTPVASVQGSGDHHDRRHRRQRSDAGATGVGRRQRAAVRLLPERPDHVGVCAARAIAAPDRRRNHRGDERQPVSMRLLQPHPLRDSSRRRTERCRCVESGGAHVRSERAAGGARVMSELNINRRAFLTGTAVVAGGLVLGVFPAQRAARDAERARRIVPGECMAADHAGGRSDLPTRQNGNGAGRADRVADDPRRGTRDRSAPHRRRTGAGEQSVSGSDPDHRRIRIGDLALGRACAPPARRRARCSLRRPLLVGR